MPAFYFFDSYSKKQIIFFLFHAISLIMSHYLMFKVLIYSILMKGCLLFREV